MKTCADHADQWVFGDVQLTTLPLREVPSFSFSFDFSAVDSFGSAASQGRVQRRVRQADEGRDGV